MTVVEASFCTVSPQLKHDFRKNKKFKSVTISERFSLEIEIQSKRKITPNLNTWYLTISIQNVFKLFVISSQQYDEINFLFWYYTNKRRENNILPSELIRHHLSFWLLKYSGWMILSISFRVLWIIYWYVRIYEVNKRTIMIHIIAWLM